MILHVHNIHPDGSRGIVRVLGHYPSSDQTDADHQRKTRTSVAGVCCHVESEHGTPRRSSMFGRPLFVSFVSKTTWWPPSRLSPGGQELRPSLREPNVPGVRRRRTRPTVLVALGVFRDVHLPILSLKH